jgi:signal transduction histidine kinase
MIAEPASAPARQPLDLSGLGLAITEHAPLPMASVEGASHVVRSVNPAFCRLMDKPKDELIGKPLCELLPEKDECVTLLDGVFRTGKPESHTEQEHSKPHPAFWSYTMWPVMADERPVGVMIQVTETAQHHERMLAMNEALLLGSVRQHELTEAAENLNEQLGAEITERKRAEHDLVAAKEEIRHYAQHLEETVRERTGQLREKIGELESFSYTLSHDMRAPLRAMRGFSRILLEEQSAKLNAEGIRHLERINAAAGLMSSLIDDVLNYARVLRSEIKMEAVDLDKLVREIIEIYPQLQTGEAEIQIESRLPGVWGNHASLWQCLSNLLTNAVKFVAPGTKPRVNVRAEAIGADIRLWVEDNGIGIAPKDRERIFRMFERVSRATDFEGTGMGLAIVRKAAERMGGTAGVESVVGQGSKFWIQLKKGANA